MALRYAGVLMPVTSLPSPYGVGSFGRAARGFVDFLARSGQKIWQVLPLVPTGYGNSPYSSTCATAGNPYFIDVDALKEQGLLTQEECNQYSCHNGDRVDYDALFNKRIPLLKLAFSRFNREEEGFKQFLAKGDYNDFSVFMALKECNGWSRFTSWAEEYKRHDNQAIAHFVQQNGDLVDFWQFTQYVFFLQWNELKEYANDKNVLIMGDMPLYVSEDSVEVWADPQLFLLDEGGYPREVAGVPPDYFSETGQLWGNPLYNWQRMAADGYAWWTKRLSRAFEMYDFVRIDHFRGFDRYYAIPAGMSDARVGEWRDGPKEDFFKDKLDWNIIAEDLGILDDGVYRLMGNTGYPGMKILQFAFDGNPNHVYKPSTYGENCVVYTGTHDNATFIEYIYQLDELSRKKFYNDLRRECAKWDVYIGRANAKHALDAIINVAYLSKAKFVIIPIQDLLALGKGARINRPGVLDQNNWTWRLKEGMLDGYLVKRLKGLTAKSRR